MSEQPYLERVASGYKRDPEVDDRNPAFVVLPDVDTLADRQKARATNRIIPERTIVPGVRRSGGSPIVDAAIKTLERSALTDVQKVKLRDLLG